MVLLPVTVEHNDYVVKGIKPLVKRLRKENISYQLNYQNLFGAFDGNIDHITGNVMWMNLEENLCALGA